MQRGSDRMSVHRDEGMKHELRDYLRSGHPTRSEEWHDAEPGDPLGTHPDIAEVRHELGRRLGRTPFPASAPELARVLDAGHCPDEVVALLEPLPADETYRNVQELAAAVVEARADA
ncbi:DUF2795 domain-containing protein [Streptomyces albidoflavus]